jgi:hypothetical protein
MRPRSPIPPTFLLVKRCVKTVYGEQLWALRLLAASRPPAGRSRVTPVNAANLAGPAGPVHASDPATTALRPTRAV